MGMHVMGFCVFMIIVCRQLTVLRDEMCKQGDVHYKVPTECMCVIISVLVFPCDCLYLLPQKLTIFLVCVYTVYCMLASKTIFFCNICIYYHRR